MRPPRAIWVWLSDEPRHRIGVRALQVAIGLMLLYRVFTEGPFSNYLWGPRGLGSGSMQPFWGYPGLLFDLLFRSEAGTRVVLAALALGALGLILGYRTRSATFVCLLAFTALQNRLQSLSDGGDNITSLVLVYTLFLLPASSQAARRSLPVWLHNLAVLSVIAQLMILYVTSGFMKAHGSVWHNGTALYVISQVDTFSLPALRWIFRNEFVVTLSTYSTMFYQVWFPVAMVSRLKLPWLFLGMCFHFGIAVFMGLVSFSTVMIGMELFLISDEEYRRIVVRVREFTQSIARFVRGGAAPRYVLFIDGFCPTCRRAAAALERLDVRGRLAIRSFRHGEEYRDYGITAEGLERRMYLVDLRSRRVYGGFAAVRSLVSGLFLLWPLGPFVAVAGWSGHGDQLYDALASRRRILPDPRACGGHCILGSEVPARSASADGAQLE